MAQGRLGLALLAGYLGFAGPAPGAEVISNSSYPESEIARSLLRGVFGMRVRAWPDGTPVRVFVLEDTSPIHEEFAKSVLQVYPYQLRQNWDRLLYSGTGQQPITVSSEDELLRRVAETPGAIGYLSQYRPGPSRSASNTGKTGSPAVKVLNVR